MAAARYYVYELVDPKDGTVFYVGKGQGDRLLDHGMASDKSNKRKLNKINKIGRKNVIRRKVAMFWDEQAAYIHEAERIVDLLPTGCLTNSVIATTISKERKLFPVLTIAQCNNYMKAFGWAIIYDPAKYDAVLWDGTCADAVTTRLC